MRAGMPGHPRGNDVPETRQCDLDFIDIYGHGHAKFGVEQAERYYEGLIATFDLLANNLRMTRERPEFRPPVRLHAYRAHKIAYIIEAEEILIVRVLHGRQDWERHLA